MERSVENKDSNEMKYVGKIAVVAVKQFIPYGSV